MPRCQVKLYCCGQEMSYVPKYKYLSRIMHEHLSATPTIEALTSAASKSYGRVVGIFKQLKNLGYKSYKTLYHAYVTPILNDSAAVWEFADQNEPQLLQNRIACFFLGVHKFTAISATALEMNWLDIKYQRWTETARYKNRLCSMKEDRLPVKVFKWMKSLNIEGWAQDIKHVPNYASMDDCQGLHAHHHHHYYHHHPLAHPPMPTPSPHLTLQQTICCPLKLIPYSP